MKLISITSKNTPADLHHILRRNIGNVVYKLGGGYESDKDFIGNVTSSSISIRRKIHYVNGYSPIFYGVFKQDKDGVTISGFFTCHPIAWIISLFFILIGINGIGKNVYAGLLPLALGIIPFVVTLIANFGSTKSTKLIIGMLSDSATVDRREIGVGVKTKG